MIAQWGFATQVGGGVIGQAPQVRAFRQGGADSSAPIAVVPGCLGVTGMQTFGPTQR